MPNKKNGWRFWMLCCFLGSVVAQWGCVSGAPMRGPRIAPKGRVRLNLTPNALSVVVPVTTSSSSSTPQQTPSVALPAVDIALAYGINEIVDIQFHVNTFGYLTAGTGFQLVRSQFFDLSISLDVGGVFFGLGGVNFGYLTFPLNVWAGLNLHKHFGINLSAGYQGYFFFAGVSNLASASLFAHTFVSSLAFDIRVNDFFTLRPQGSVTVPFVGGGYVNGLLWTAGLGLIFTFGGPPKQAAEAPRG